MRPNPTDHTNIINPVGQEMPHLMSQKSRAAPREAPNLTRLQL